jgi:hypothetical protein
MNEDRIRPRDRDAIVQSLRAGVVPFTGLQHVQVGRAVEIRSLLADIERVADGGSAFRLIIGEYGSGKTFFLSLMRTIALERKMVTARADLHPDRRLHATGGQGRSLYAEMMRNLATRARPEGGALPGVVEKFAGSAAEESKERGVGANQIIEERLHSLEELVGGYDFASVIGQYWKGYESGSETLMRDAERWLRGEFSTKTDARVALGVRTFIDDDNVYDNLKLMAKFVRLSGYSGLFITLDELVNLYKLGSSQARSANYEQILRILNDSLQGSCEGLAIVMGGTPEFLSDPRRGLFSYQALASRLSDNAFANSKLVDNTGPVIKLKNLTPEDLYILLERLRNVFAYGDPTKYLVPDEALESFMKHCSRKIGDSYFRTPRTTIKAFLDFLAILEQNPAAWTDLIEQTSIDRDRGPTDIAPMEEDDGLATIRL